MKIVFFSFLLITLFAINSDAQTGWFKIKTIEKSHWRNPGGSFAGSLLFPGYGYFANDMMKEGFIYVGVQAVIIGTGLYYLQKPLKYTTKPNGVRTSDALENKEIAFKFFASAAGLQLIHAVHATLLTHKFNKVNGYAFENENNRSVEVNTAGIGIQVKLNF